MRRAADARLDLSVFRLAVGSDLADAGELPKALPLAASDCTGEPTSGRSGC